MVNDRSGGLIESRVANVLVADASQGSVTAYSGALARESARASFSGKVGCVYHAGDKIIINVDEDIVRLNPDTLAPETSHIAGGDAERILLSPDGKLLYILLPGANTILMTDAETGEWIASARAGSNPRDMRMDRDGARIAVAGGDSRSVYLFDSATLETIKEYPLGGCAVGCVFFGDTLLTLSEAGEWEPEPITAVSGLNPTSSEMERLFLLPSIPTYFTFALTGMLVGHMNGITMVDPWRREIIWRMNLVGLPDLITPMGRQACYIDRLTGKAGIIDCVNPGIIASLRIEEPNGIAVMNLGI